MRTAMDEYHKYLKVNNVKRRKRNREDPLQQEEEYYSAKRVYQKMLRKSKDKAFEIYCTTNMNKDLFKSLKTLSSSQINSQMPTELIVEGKSITEE
jgi:hypothetical protein